MKKCTLGRILRSSDGTYGYRVSFKTRDEALKYKDETRYIIQVDGYKIQILEGVNDELL